MMIAPMEQRCLKLFGEVDFMRKFTTDNDNINEITFKGVKYLFILDEDGVGIRRKDDKKPKEKEVAALTDYLFEEGWANREDFEERESWKDNA
jgi:hypothetical protein